jgi:hypothetical protein
MIWLLLLIAAAFVISAKGATLGTGLGTPIGDFSPQAVLFGQAIAVAEGTVNRDGSLNTGSLGIQLNNPGDLEDSSGQLRSFATIEDGWNALYSQADAMLNGTSRIYRQNMTIAQAAYLYTGNDHAIAWATAVAQQLGLSINSTLSQANALIIVG